MKKFVILRKLAYIFMALVMFAAGFGIVYGIMNINNTHPKEYDSGLGLTVTLPSSFRKLEGYGKDYALGNKDVVFVVEKASKTEIESVGNDFDAMTLKAFAQMQIEGNNLGILASSVSTDEENGFVYFSYTKFNNGEAYFYMAYVLKEKNGFFLCQFGCLNTNRDSFTKDFKSWAKTFKYEKYDGNLQPIQPDQPVEPDEPTEMQFQLSNGVTITLTTDFVKQPVQNGMYSIAKNDCVFMASNEDKNGTTYSAYEYASLTITANSISSTAYQEDELVYFDYTNSTQGTTFKYRAFVFVGENDYYLCQFATEISDFAGFEEQIINWAKTITVV